MTEILYVTYEDILIKNSLIEFPFQCGESIGKEILYVNYLLCGQFPIGAAP